MMTRLNADPCALWTLIAQPWVSFSRSAVFGWTFVTVPREPFMNPAQIGSPVTLSTTGFPSALS